MQSNEAVYPGRGDATEDATEDALQGSKRRVGTVSYSITDLPRRPEVLPIGSLHASGGQAFKPEWLFFLLQEWGL